MAKKLDFDYDFDEDYYAIEVLSPLMDYEFAWMINKETGLKFRRTNHFHVYNEKSASSSEYALFIWQRLENITYYLSHPCETTNLLMPVYYFFIQGPEKEEIIGSFLEKLQNLPDVVSADYIHIGAIEDYPDKKQTAAFKRRIEKIFNILFDLEDHLRAMKKEIKAQKMNLPDNFD